MRATLKTRRRNLSPGVAAWLVLAAASAAVAQDAANVDLSWRLKPGQTLKYRFHQVTDLTLSADGQSGQRLNDLAIDLTWTVDSVAGDGSATITQRIDRVHAEVTAGPQSIVYDSAEKKAEGPTASTLADLYGAAIGEPYTLTLGRDGRLSDAKVPAKVTEALKSSPYQAQADGGSVFSPEGLKRMFAQAIPKVPGGPSAVGATWDETLAVPSGPLVMTLSQAYKLASVAADGAKVTAAIKTDVAPRQGLALKVETKAQSGEGDYLFDAPGGHLVRTTVKQAFDSTFEAGGRKTEQSISITIRFEELSAAE